MAELKVIDLETGEDRSKEYTLRHRNQDRMYNEKQSFQGRQPSFTVSNMRNLHEVYEALTTAQCGYLMLLQCYVNFDGGTLVNGDKHPMTKSEMKTILQLDKKPRTFYDFYSACVKNGIIIENDHTYAVNQRYHFRGAFDDQFVVKSYTAKIKRVYREVKAADIGLIYRMIPFVHMKTNALCSNPFEKDPQKISWFNRKELAEAIGVNPDTLYRRLPNMRFDDEYVVARIKLGKEPERYTFNPSVFYRQNSAPEDGLIAMFNVNPRK